MFNRIKQVREVLNLSQREFGENLGVSRDVISNIEYNRVQPKDLFINHMCDFYKINPEWLETGTGEMFLNNNNLTAKSFKALQIFQSLTPVFQEYALKQIEELVALQDKVDDKKTD